jgi:uncharacterized membrane protein
MSKTKIALFILIGSYTLYFSWLTISRHQNLFSGRFDLGNMEQTVWNTSQGRIFQMTNPNSNNLSSRLAFHADFLLILIAPIYKLFPFTETLLIIQALIIALGAIPVYLIAKRILPVGIAYMRSLPLFFSLLYLLSPIMERANIFEFHSEVLATTFLLFTFYFLLSNKTKSFLLFFFLSLISKETICLTLSMICFWGIIKNKNRKLCFALFIFCFLYFFAMVKFIIPSANETMDKHFALSHFEGGEEGLESVISSYIKNPIKLIIAILNNDSLKYYQRILSSIGYLPILSPIIFLFSLPTILINIIVKDPQFRSLGYQYSATAVPGLIISTIYSTKFLTTKITLICKKAAKKKISILAMEQWNNRTVLFVFLLIIIYGIHRYSPLPYIGRAPYLDFLTYHYPQKEKLLEWSTKIPESTSVSVTNNAGSHFARRQNLYVFPNNYSNSDYIVISGQSWQEWVTNEERNQIIAKLKQNFQYKLVEESKELWIFKKI